MKPIWLLIDVSNWAHKDLHGCGPGSIALRTFARRVELCEAFFKPERIAFCFDCSGPTFRSELDPCYKANRRKSPLVGLSELIDEIRDYAIENAHDIASCEGFEADDVIATLSTIGIDSERKVMIASSDKDLRQLLVAGQVILLRNIKRGKDRPEPEYFSAAHLLREYGLKPEQWIDYQALVGDATDNIRGCDGIGKKTAEQLLRAVGSLDEHYRDVWRAPITKTQARKLSEFRGRDLELARKLVTLRRDVPLPACHYPEKV